MHGASDVSELRVSAKDDDNDDIIDSNDSDDDEIREKLRYAQNYNDNSNTRVMALCPGLPG